MNPNYLYEMARQQPLQSDLALPPEQQQALMADLQQTQDPYAKMDAYRNLMKGVY